MECLVRERTQGGGGIAPSKDRGEGSSALCAIGVSEKKKPGGRGGRNRAKRSPRPICCKMEKLGGGLGKKNGVGAQRKRAGGRCGG